MGVDIAYYKNRVQRKKGQLKQIQKSITNSKRDIKELNSEAIYIEEAQLILQTVAQKTQEELEYHISEIVTLALSTIYNDAYEFSINFISRRNKTEADLFFVRNDEKIDPLTASGGGVVDIASFALRIAMWNLQKPRSTNTIILDEPFKHLSINLMDKAGELLKEISEKLNIQFLIITHSEILARKADKAFAVIIKKGISNIVE